jgi:aminoglycoside phosphotransferase (APT) family kinase protein
MNNIKQRYHQLEEIQAGWSFDQKFKAYQNDTKQVHFIRISNDDHLDAQRYRFDVMNTLFKLGCLIQKPISFEHIEDKIIQTFDWLEGDTLEKLLPQLDESTQYEWGVQAGQQLKIIHKIPSRSAMNIFDYYQNRVNKKLSAYHACEFKLEREEMFSMMLKDGWDTLNNITTSFQHGDFHVENMVYHQNQVHIIDFNRADEGDPWQEFDRIAFSARVSPAFAKGQIHGYFDYQPPIEFYIRLRFYLAINSFSSIPWASINYGISEVEHMKKIANEILAWYKEDDVIPLWMK